MKTGMNFLSKKILFCIAATGLFGLMLLPIPVRAVSDGASEASSPSVVFAASNDNPKKSTVISFFLSLPSLDDFFSPLQSNLNLVVSQGVSLARAAALVVSSLEQETNDLKTPLFAAVSFPGKAANKALDLSSLLNERAAALSSETFLALDGVPSKLEAQLPIVRRQIETLSSLPSKASSFLAAAITPKQQVSSKSVISKQKQEPQHSTFDIQHSPPPTSPSLASLAKAVASLKAQSSSFPRSVAKSLSALSARIATLEKQQKQAVSDKQKVSDKQVSSKEVISKQGIDTSSFATSDQLEATKQYLLTQVRFASNAIVGGYAAGGGAGTVGFFNTNRIENFTTDKALTANDTLLVKGNATLEKNLTLQGDLSFNGATILSAGKGTFTAIHSPLLVSDSGDLRPFPSIT